MSVQAGVWNFDKVPISSELLRFISHETSKYGLDGETIINLGSIGLLYRPFQTASDAMCEQQPHTSARGRLVLWDGRLDNRDELIAQLTPATENLESDVSLIGAAFDRWHTNCLSKLVGEWSLTIWDPDEKELILARDYIGVRRLFYQATDRGIHWCTQLAPLALISQRLSLCDEYVAGFLASDPDPHLTPYKDIKSVPPGAFVRVRNHNVTVTTYWAFDPSARTLLQSDSEYEEYYRHLFRQAVRRRLRSNSPILSHLSGGFDSSSIVCMADDIVATELPNVRLDSLSFFDSYEPEDDDIVYFTKVEAKRKRDGYHIDLRGAGDSLTMDYSAFVAAPGFGLRQEMQRALSETLRCTNYKVLLSGRFGDDVNGQGLDPRVQLADLFWDFKWIELAKQLTVWSLLIRKRPWIQLFFQTLLQLMPITVRAKFTLHAQMESWVNPAIAKKYRMVAHQFGSVNEPWFMRPTRRQAMQTLAIISRRLTCTESSIIETRYPYLDQDLVKFLTSIPFDQLLRPGERRSLMRRALVNFLPPEVLARRTKASSIRCYSVALEKHWNKVCGSFSEPISSELGYIDKDKIMEALRAMKSGHFSTQSVSLLNAISLEFWLRDVQKRGILSIESSTIQKNESLEPRAYSEQTAAS